MREVGRELEAGPLPLAGGLDLLPGGTGDNVDVPRAAAFEGQAHVSGHGDIPHLERLGEEPHPLRAGKRVGLLIGFQPQGRRAAGTNTFQVRGGRGLGGHAVQIPSRLQPEGQATVAEEVLRRGGRARNRLGNLRRRGQLLQADRCDVHRANAAGEQEQREILAGSVVELEEPGLLDPFG